LSMPRTRSCRSTQPPLRTGSPRSDFTSGRARFVEPDDGLAARPSPADPVGVMPGLPENSSSLTSSGHPSTGAFSSCPTRRRRGAVPASAATTAPARCSPRLPARARGCSSKSTRAAATATRGPQLPGLRPPRPDRRCRRSNVFADLAVVGDLCVEESLSPFCNGRQDRSAGTRQWGRGPAPLKPRRPVQLARPAAQGDQAKTGTKRQSEPVEP
jgi:hypothetical protein